MMRHGCRPFNSDCFIVFVDKCLLACFRVPADCSGCPDTKTQTKNEKKIQYAVSGRQLHYVCMRAHLHQGGLQRVVVRVHQLTLTRA